MLSNVLLAAFVFAVAPALAQSIDKDRGPRPPQGMAQVVFLRNGGHENAISVYRVLKDDQELIGILHGRDKLAYPVAPGDYTFMVLGGESQDFLEAHLASDKTYYVIAGPRMGWGTNRYSLLPVVGKPGDLPPWQWKWNARSPWVTLSEEDRAWYSKRRDFVSRRRAQGLEKWNARGERGSEEQVLKTEDGF